MSLIRCSECGKKVSNKAEACPGCGAPVVTSIEVAKKKGGCGGVIGCLTVALLLVVTAIAVLPSVEIRNPAGDRPLQRSPAPVNPVPRTQSQSSPKEMTGELKRLWLEQMKRWFEGIDSTGVLIDDVSIRSADKCLIVTVTNEWHRQQYQERLQVAQVIQKKWESVSSSGAFSLVDGLGNEVGGLGFTGVWVQEAD